MQEYEHSFQVLRENCRGKRACMRVCPTHAIRVWNGGPQVDPTLCIDCGKCIVACPDVFRPLTDSWDSIQRFPYKVAVPSAALFSQFPMDVTPANVIDGLLALGFDAVYPLCTETEMINLAIRDYLDESRGPYPLVSSTCPAVVRLVQVAYPDMVGQVIPIECPREIAGREMKKVYSKRTDLPPGQIGAIYLSPCQCKVSSIRQPAENGDVQSYLDLAIGISDIYNSLLTAITALKKESPGAPEPREKVLRSRIHLAWATLGGESQALQPSRHISVSDLPNVIRVLDDVEKGKIRGIEFLECYACTGGCVGGPLTVDQTYVSLAKLHRLIEGIGEDEVRHATKEARRRYVKGDYALRETLQFRPLGHRPIAFEERVERMKARDDMMRMLPGIDCGLCGAPTCDTFAADVASGTAELDHCVLLSDIAVDDIRKRYGMSKASMELTAKKDPAR